MTLLHPTMALLGSTSLYYTLYLGSTWLYLTLLHSTMALLSSAGLYLTLLYTLPWLYVALLDSVQGRIQVGGGGPRGAHAPHASPFGTEPAQNAEVCHAFSARSYFDAAHISI